MPRFLLDPDVAFLNHGSFGATPREVLDEQLRWREEMEREPVDFLVHRLRALLEAARERAARFVGADPEGLVFMPNATTAVSAVLASLPLAAGDEVLLTAQRYDAVRRAAEVFAGRAGARVVEAPVPWPGGDPDEVAEAVLSTVGPRTRVAVLDQVASPTGLVLPAARIAAAARARGVAVLVDGAHAPGQVELEVARLGADWWVGNLHKWALAPKGCALLWIAPERRATTRALVVSHGWGGGPIEEFGWPGTHDPTAYLAAPRALDLLDELGGPALRRAHHELLRAGSAVVAAALGLPPPPLDGPAVHAAMVALPLPLPAADGPRLRDLLHREHRVEVAVTALAGRALLRLSAFAAYNRIEDYERLAAALPAALPAARRG